MTVLLLTSSFFMFFMLYIGMKMWSTVFYMINLLTKKTSKKKECLQVIAPAFFSLLLLPVVIFHCKPASAQQSKMQVSVYP